MDVNAVVRSCYEAWSRRDVDAILDTMHDDCTYVLHVPQDVLPYGGEHVGRDNVRRCIDAMLAEFSFVAIAVDWLRVDGHEAHSQLVYFYNHIPSGESLDGRLRHVWHVAGGLVTRIDEYHDVPRLKAFLEMVKWLRKT